MPDSVDMRLESLKSVSLKTGLLSIFSGLLLVVPLLVMFKPATSLRMVLMFLPFFLLLSFAFLHGWWSMRRGIVVLLLTVVMTFFIEWMSINFGVPFGHYHYTDKLGTLVFDVPWVIPFQWFNVLYPSYFMACIIFPTMTMSGMDAQANRFDLNALLARGLITAAFMVGWDLINDPLMATVVGMWIWESPTEFFGLVYEGIPLSNYIGWAITVFVVVAIFELVAHFLRVNVNWVSGSAHNRSNILVIVPYAFNYLIQLVQVLGLGTITITTPLSPLVPILATGSLILSVLVVLLVYLQRCKSPST